MENLEIQKNELSYLEQIYLSDMEMQTTMSPFKFQVYISPYFDSQYLEDYDNSMDVKLQIEINSKYPREQPKLRIIPQQYKYDSSYFNHINQIMESLHNNPERLNENENSELNIESCYIYQFLENTRLWLQDRFMKDVIIPKYKDEIMQDQQINEKQNNRTVFTPVTMETFLGWKKMFDLELAEQKKKSQEGQKENTMYNSISGKQWFERNRDQPNMEVYQIENEDEDDEDDDDDDDDNDELEEDDDDDDYEEEEEDQEDQEEEENK